MESTPHLIWRRVWLAQSDDSKGRLSSANSINFYKFPWKTCNTFSKEVTDNVKKINKLQDFAQQSSEDGKGPPEKLKMVI